jgi:hypothetical protein
MLCSLATMGETIVVRDLVSSCVGAAIVKLRGPRDDFELDFNRGILIETN